MQINNHKNSYDPVSFTDTELNLGVIVAEYNP